MGSSEDPSLVNNVDDLGLVYLRVKYARRYHIFDRANNGVHLIDILSDIYDSIFI